MKTYAKKISKNTLEITDNLDKFEKLSNDLIYEVTIKEERNYEFHKKFFAMIKVGHNNTSLDMPFDAYRKYIIMKAGYFDIYKTDKGSMIIPKSISFDKMNEDEFRECYSRCLDKVIEDTKADRELFEKELMSFIN
jgi:hypothetical protein